MSTRSFTRKVRRFLLISLEVAAAEEKWHNCQSEDHVFRSSIDTICPSAVLTYLSCLFSFSIPGASGLDLSALRRHSMPGLLQRPPRLLRRLSRAYVSTDFLTSWHCLTNFCMRICPCICMNVLVCVSLRKIITLRTLAPSPDTQCWRAICTSGRRASSQAASCLCSPVGCWYTAVAAVRSSSFHA